MFYATIAWFSVWATVLFFDYFKYLNNPQTHNFNILILSSICLAAGFVWLLLTTISITRKESKEVKVLLEEETRKWKED